MHTAARLQPFGTTIFAEMTALANAHGAVNLAQGFPDYDGPQVAIKAAVSAASSAKNQYARSFGVPELLCAIASRWNAERVASSTHAAHVADPDSSITVTSGCTEALAACVLGLLNPGDEIILFEPYYDSYAACVAMAGATAKYVALRPSMPGGPFMFNEADLRAAISPRTRAILVNTPHNPTGKVFTREELSSIAKLCIEHDIIAITDEVYEDLVYNPELPHISLATLEGMWDRTITLSSLGKSFALTGWKIGWAIATPSLTRAVRSAHQFLTFASATPLQYGAAAAITEGLDFLAPQRAMLIRNRDALASALTRLGMIVHPSDGTYFIMADHTPLSAKLGLADDVQLCRHLTQHVGVAAIPPSAFYANKALGRPFVRFAYCKQEATIALAIQRLATVCR